MYDFFVDLFYGNKFSSNKKSDSIRKKTPLFLLTKEKQLI